MALLTDKLKELLSSESKQSQGSAPGRKPARIIAICSQKGGVGKTTTAVNLGATLSKFHKKKVLVVDLDPQGHVEKSLGSIIPDGIEYTPVSVVLTAKNGKMDNAVIKTEIETLHITPGDRALNETESALSGKIGREFILSQSLKSVRTLYDFIILDCPPNLGNLTINALCAADYAIVPCEMSVLAFEGVSDLLDTLEAVNDRLNRKLKVLGVLFTRVDGRNVTMNQLVEENLKQYFKGNIFKTRVSVNTDLNKAQLEGLPIFAFAPSSTGASNYQAFAGELLKKLHNRSSHA